MVRLEGCLNIGVESMVILMSLVMVIWCALLVMVSVMHSSLRVEDAHVMGMVIGCDCDGC